MSKTVFKNSVYYTLASLLPAVIHFVMLPIYSRYLTPADYGIVALVLSLQVFLSILLTMKIEASISRFYFDYKNDTLKIYITTIIFVVFIIATLMLLFLFLFLEEILIFVFPKTSENYYVLFQMGLLSSYFSVFISIFVKLIRVQQKAKLFMKISLLIFVISLIINISEVIILKKGAYGIVEATLIASIISTITYLFIVRKFFIKKIDLFLLIQPIKYSIPLIPHALAGFIFMYSDRIILEKYVTLSALGLYIFSDRIATIFKMLVNEFKNAFLPYFMQKAIISKEAAINEARKISLIVTYFTSMLMTVFALFSVEFVYYLLDEKYFDVWRMIPLLASSYIFRSLYLFSSGGLFFEKKTGKILMITLVAGAVNIGLNLLFIPIYGVMAAIYTTIFSFFLTFIIAEMMSHKLYNLHLRKKKNIVILLYLFGSITYSLWLNKFFFEFGLIDYLYKLFVIGLGVFIGYKINLFHFNKLKLLWAKL